MNRLRFVYHIALLSLGTTLLGSCSQSQRLGVEDDPQELLEGVLDNSTITLTPDQSISVINHGAQLGEQIATNAADKVVTVFMGNTGAGKSTTINCLVGCKMKAEIDEFEEEKISVDPESNIAEVMPIGHDGPSKTFLPQIVQNPNNPDRVYCDCPGFFDNRKPEINITNAINVKKILKQARGIKIVFLTEYADLVGTRGRNIKDMFNLCKQMFGDGEAGVNNLRDCQTAVLLGITKAPAYDEDDEPITRNTMRALLEDTILGLEETNRSIAQILANRIFLFDPLDRENDNPDFWSLERCRTEIMQLHMISQKFASTLFQTVLNNDDRMHLLDTVRRLRPKITRAIAREEVATIGQYWQLLQRLQVIQHPEVDRLIQGEVSPALENTTLRLIGDFKDDLIVRDLDGAQKKLGRITKIINSLPGASFNIDVAKLNRHLEYYKTNQKNEKAMRETITELQAEIERLKRKKTFACTIM